MRNYTDFTTLQKISSGAALILAAEFDRAYKTRMATPTAIDVDQWNPTVRDTLEGLGFFKMMGFDDRYNLPPTNGTKPFHEKLYITPMISGRDAELEPIIEPLQALLSQAMLDDVSKVALTSALFEAIENVRRHAYPNAKRNAWQIPPLWWLGGSFDRQDDRLTISLYDQGATIPWTIINSPLWRTTAESWMKLTGKDMYDDKLLLTSAMQVQNSSSVMVNRGLGLPKIREIVSKTPGGSLLIISRRGIYRFNDKEETCEVMQLPLYGSYVELSATFPKPLNVL